MRSALVVFGIYVAATLVYTWPLVSVIGSRVPSDPADPVLNTSILWWNATTMPLTEAWWNALHYYPSQGVAAFTENLLGISVISSPVYWITRNPVTAHNVAYFLTFPLSGLALYLLVSSMTPRRDAAFIAGFAFAFTPYRTTEIAHVQSLSIYWLPAALAALHQFLKTDDRRWLIAFAIAWPLQALSNGYFLLYGAVVIGCWLLYFCTVPERWRAGVTILLVWLLASLALAPIFLRYSTIHERFGLIRDFNEIVAYSATATSFVQVSGDVWFWRFWLPQGKDDLFPGVTLVLLVLAAAIVTTRRSRRLSQAARWTTVTRTVLWILFAVSVAAFTATLTVGPWNIYLLDVNVRTRDLIRPSLAVAITAGLLIVMSRRARKALRQRTPIVFYGAMTLVIALLCCGPLLRAGGTVLMAQAPYRWLMALPGFGELRVPPRFWMLGVMCLATAGGLALAAIAGQRRASVAMLALVLGGLALDGWIPTMRTAAPPESWADVEPAGRPEPILELPLGPDWDWDATYRAVGHRRRVVNGVSGYDPPHYVALRSGLEARDPAMLQALAALGPYDVVVRDDQDADGRRHQFVAAAPGSTMVSSARGRTIFRIPQGPPEISLGPTISIVKAKTFRFSDLFARRDDRDAIAIHDGSLTTFWDDYPQQPGQWIEVDLGSPREVAGVTQSIGGYLLDFPSRLRIEASLNETEWTGVWEGAAAPAAFLALVRGPREGSMRFAFAPVQARYVRLLQLDRSPHAWHVAEIQIHAPK